MTIRGSTFQTFEGKVQDEGTGSGINSQTCAAVKATKVVDEGAAE